MIDGVEAAAALGGTNILIAFFSNGGLRLRDAMGEFRVTDDGPFRENALDELGVTRVVETLRQIVAPRAGRRQHPRAREHAARPTKPGDAGARRLAHGAGVLRRRELHLVRHDVPTEIRLLGKDRICEIHIKETLGLDDPNTPLLGGPAAGGLDFQAAPAACRDIGYDRW